MTRRQWVWLWIWILTFFFIFCIWNKLQENSRNSVLEESTATKIIAPIKKNLSFKIIKDDKKIKLIALLPNEASAQKIIQSFKNSQYEVDRSEVTIDKDTKESPVLDQISLLSQSFSQLQSGYIEYGDDNLILDGITNNQNIKDKLYAQALKLENVNVENKIFIDDIQSIEESIKNIDNTISSVEIEIDDLSNDRSSDQQDNKKSISEIQVELDNILKNQRVEFKYGKNTLTSKGKNTIDNVLEFLITYPNIKVEIGGHTDSDGKRKSNQILSQKRADFIQAYFISNDIEENRLTSVGYGETQSIVTNDSLENKQKNRRVEFKIIGEE